jgi:type I restriction enzyme R subunit
MSGLRVRVLASMPVDANRVKKTLIERLDEDPIACRRFSQLLTETIEAYRAGRLSELEYLKRAQAILAQVQQGTDRAIPAKLQRYRDARAYYVVSRQELGIAESSSVSDEDVADMAIDIERLIDERKIRDWVRNRDIQKAMMNDIEDYLYSRTVPESRLSSTVLDRILDQVLEIAKQRDRLST